MSDREITLLFDGVGGANGQQAFDLLGVGGRALMFGWSGGGFIEFTPEDRATTGKVVLIPQRSPTPLSRPRDAARWMTPPHLVRHRINPHRESPCAWS